jgi:hypothetical protein
MTNAEKQQRVLMRRKMRLVGEIEQLRKLGHERCSELVQIEAELETVRGQLEAEALKDGA